MEWTTSFSHEFGRHLNECFKLPYKTLTKIRFYLTKDLHITLKEFDELEFYEILFLLDEYKEWVEEENKRNGEQNEKHNAEMERVRSSMPDYNNMSQNMPKMPSMPNMSMPSIPSFSMPSFPS